MNLYFWLFSLYALWITPVHISTSLRLGKEIRHHTRIRIAGIAIRKKESQEAESRLRGNDVARGIFSMDLPLVLRLLRRGHIGRAFGSLKMESVYLHVRISFADAAATAMCYAAVRILIQTALSCLPLAGRLSGRVDMDFEGAGSEVFMRCMFSTRLGILIAAVLRLMLAVIRERAARMKPEEEPYAAASH